MKLRVAREAYSYNSEKAGNLIRQIGFAGIALIWIFGLEEGNQQNLPYKLKLSAFCIVGSLAADLLQYIGATGIWGWWQWHNERKVREIEKTKGLGKTDSNDWGFPASEKLNWWHNALFWIKAILIVAAYIPMLLYMYERVID